MVDSKGNASVSASGDISEITRGQMADRASERRTENGDKSATHGQNAEPVKKDTKKPAAKKPAKKSAKK